MKGIAIFASGAGSNAEKIIEHFNRSGAGAKSKTAAIKLIVSNRPGAGVLKIADANYIPTLIVDKEKFLTGNGYVEELKTAGIDFIVLAGFLWKVPVSLIQAFSKKIINIHPALLPNYGVKGMYGKYVHEAVLANKEKESGISIHYVDEVYDHGDIIFQARCAVVDNDTPESLAHRVHLLEHEHYPKIIESILLP